MIFHVVPLDDWLRNPDRPYAPPGLAADGFVHCSPDEATALAVAEAFYRQAAGPLMVLLIDEHALDSPVRWEAPEPAPPPGSAAGVLFPHIYGRVNRAAVAGMLEVRRDAGGHPTGLRAWS
ncbi:DUF952 domain-containing protein [Streptomyces sp. SL13]|uniref:DUF952 domain-containing protein n=1 Tax=Streptantibioticus silvisoli TaxID=2705255 RepID=A0AA90K9V6_9ACTN|nr:DUF952 domain-containing protein [Streptantibioticus silvisoli]MDI5966326.1 DUF952 domain-containing protein [Streptantibioticus silvisoli]MDI5971668.1 DUF952 domain-containing protein [Streptantibioticus silvisoli]